MMIGSTAIEHPVNIFRLAWMEYSKMRKILLRSFFLSSWFKRFSMSFGKELSHKVHELLFQGWFLIQNLSKGL